MSTHKFILPTGVECEILAANMGDFETLLSASQKQNAFSDALAKVLSEKIVRLGSTIFAELQPYQREKIVAQMMPCDRDYSLLTMRQFAYDFPTEFTFFVEYTESSKRVKSKITMPLGEDGNFLFQPTEKQHSDYAEIEKDLLIEIQGQTIKVPIMVGETVEKVNKALKGKKDLLFADGLAMRGCAKKTESGWVAMTANDFKKMLPPQIGSIYAELEKHEGKVFAEHIFAHPQTEQETRINIIATKDFFLSEG